MSRNPGFGGLPPDRAPTANGPALKVRATPLGLRVSFFNPKSEGYATLPQARVSPPWSELGPSHWDWSTATAVSNRIGWKPQPRRRPTLKLSCDKALASVGPSDAGIAAPEASAFGSQTPFTEFQNTFFGPVSKSVTASKSPAFPKCRAFSPVPGFFASAGLFRQCRAFSPVPGFFASAGLFRQVPGFLASAGLLGKCRAFWQVQAATI